MDNATHVAVYFGSYLKKPPVPMSRLEHYAGQDEIGLRYNSHRTKREEYLVMSLWKGSPGMWRIRGSAW